MARRKKQETEFPEQIFISRDITEPDVMLVMATADQNVMFTGEPQVVAEYQLVRVGTVRGEVIVEFPAPRE